MSESPRFITGLHHINLLVPPHTLSLAHKFYTDTLGLPPSPLTPTSKPHLAWFDICPNQQLHITSEHYLSQAQLKAQTESPRHPCFKVPSEDKLVQLQKTIYKMYENGGDGAPVYCDEPGNDNDGQGMSGDFPRRFFARDYAGNRLEFTL